jgi:hypothetical protein
MSKFKRDQLIEVSNNPQFSGVGRPVRFQCDLSESNRDYIGGAPFVVILPSGHSGCFCYAREIEPKVKVWIDVIDANGFMVMTPFKVSKELADKIIVGDA